MPVEVLQCLSPQSGQTIVDGTLGGGGHTRLLAEAVGPTGRVIACDQDAVAIERAELALAGLPITLLHGNFCDLPELLTPLDLPPINGVLLDLGLSSDQLADAERGFSFQLGGPLDLRFDTSRGEPAWRLLNRLSSEHLADLIFAYGEERFSRRIARAIVDARQHQTIKTADELAMIVRKAIPKPRHQGSQGNDYKRIDPATRTFQALRIAVNDELKSLEIALKRLPSIMQAGGKLAVLSFHSLEDRRVKEAFRQDARYAIITRKPIRPSDDEVARNPRSRSARLRVAEIANR